MATRGWPLVGWTAIWCGVLVALSLGSVGTGAPGWHLLLVATARTSAALWLAVFLASTLRGLYPGPATAWLLRNRRYLGVSVAVSHTVHLGAIAGFAQASDGQSDPIVVALGGPAYLLLLAMVATSFDRSAAWLGRKRWRWLHRAGIWYLALPFGLTFAGNAAGGSVLAGLFTAAIAGAVLLRAIVAWRKR